MHCNKCRQHYERILFAIHNFQQFLTLSEINFNSKKLDILNIIHKNRYKDKFKYALLRHKKLMITIVASFLFIIMPRVSYIKTLFILTKELRLIM